MRQMHERNETVPKHAVPLTSRVVKRRNNNVSVRRAVKDGSVTKGVTVDAGLPDTDEVSVDAGLPDTDR